MASRKDRRSGLCAAGLAALIAIILSGAPFLPAVAGGFLKAVNDYNAGRYARALSEFKQLTADYPDNTMAHYYLGLSQQSMGNIELARTEFQWVSQHGDKKLKEQSVKAMKQLDQVKTQIAPASTTPSIVDAITQTKPHQKVRKILEFSAPWCLPCKTFEPIFEATKLKYRDVDFRKFNVDDPKNKELVHKYSARIIPKAVFLDGSGNVLYSGRCPQSEEGFSGLINQFR